MVMTLTVPTSERILRRILSVQAQIDKADKMGQDPDCLASMRKAYVADLIDVLNEEERSKPRGKRISYNLATTESWIEDNTKDSTP